MKRILCTSCGTQPPVFESELWPSVRLCYQCNRNFTESLAKTGFADGNTFFQEFAFGMCEYDRFKSQNFFLVTTHSDYGKGSWGQMRIRIER